MSKQIVTFNSAPYTRMLLGKLAVLIVTRGAIVEESVGQGSETRVFSRG